MLNAGIPSIRISFPKVLFAKAHLIAFIIMSLLLSHSAARTVDVDVQFRAPDDKKHATKHTQRTHTHMHGYHGINVPYERENNASEHCLLCLERNQKAYQTISTIF